jgi:hypothetical protein
MGSSGRANILVVANRTAATPALLDAVRERAERSPAHFHLIVPDPEHDHLRHPHDHSAGDKALALALPLVREAAGGHADRSVSIRHDPMDAIEETLRAGEFDEIILSTLPRHVSHWLHLDLPSRVAHLGLPLTTVIAGDRERAGVS